MSLGRASASPVSRPALSDVTQILNRVQQGDEKAGGELLPLVYEELRKLAAKEGRVKMLAQARFQTVHWEVEDVIRDCQ